MTDKQSDALRLTARLEAQPVWTAEFCTRAMTHNAKVNSNEQ